MKLIFSILCFLFVLGTGKSQNSAYSFAHNGDTVTNAETEFLTFKVTNADQDIVVQYVATKMTGTVAGTATLQGSLDGVNYVNAVVNESGTAAFTNTDVATQSNFWYLYPGKYLYYRIKCTGTGTMAAKVYGYLMPR